jgi:hypothetical protein
MMSPVMMIWLIDMKTMQKAKKKMKRRRNLLHHHLLKMKSALKARHNFADHEMVLSYHRYIMWCAEKGDEFFINMELIE